ncbi:hypothetical protein PHYBLDRAFT_146070 [Phycomyces blakesleeanus NRRL 1555(-)]|uniref:Uncharacterized protein n=1 Tax=Phycomyces blakesleeanus (strain ATCC 8743b / DSM 1359 / FGSC 10004 / NBRC 33097 / NRRL 1555) TaxID=763407 RepID=A0A167MG07_PHYB8|nr:hypothetical protein PHYBLDRAFT_146070 [Phycomyces blakesleeanus NRRL 1555(-)]OAD72749.1 hypothetical protein PHYBLDRAFT_146070 [Phycomyces blakesleeanus NRRL 1555(-)]|eukprot:XP_018290789.1 hypothetical protein PHYBLDRAFT_146070 [Phycomyces blakesleeanus NRRL 1555(-)]
MVDRHSFLKHTDKWLVRKGHVVRVGLRHPFYSARDQKYKRVSERWSSSSLEVKSKQDSSTQLPRPWPVSPQTKTPMTIPA